MSGEYDASDNEGLNIKGVCMPLTHGECKKKTRARLTNWKIIEGR